MQKFSLPVMVLGIHLMVVTASVAAPRLQRIDPGRLTVITPQRVEPISQAQARTLENRLSQLPAAEVLRIPPRVVRPIGEPPSPPVNETSDPPTPPRPTGPRLELVETSPALERELTRALASQTSIANVVGGSGSILPFPGMIRQVEQSGEEVQLKAFALAGKRLRYDADNGMFTGTIWLGVNEIVGGRPARRLVAPVDFAILDADSANPPQVRVLQTGSPYSQVQLQLATAVDGSAVKIVSSLAPDPISLALPLNPALILEAGNSSIEGLGLGTSQINVSVMGLANPKGRIVTLTTNSGFLSDTKLKLDENGTASAILRSDGIGPASVAASSVGLGSTRLPVDYRLPATTFLASIVGGLAGGAIRLGSGRRRKPGKIAGALLISVLLGMLVFALYAIGINVLPITPSVTVGAVFVFAVSGLGAFLGPRVLGSR